MDVFSNARYSDVLQVVLDALVLWRATAEAEANALRSKRRNGQAEGSSMSSFDSGSSSGHNPRAPLRKGLSSLMVTKTGKAKKFRPTKVCFGSDLFGNA